MILMEWIKTNCDLILMQIQFIITTSHVTIHGIKKEKDELNVELLAFISLFNLIYKPSKKGENFHLWLVLHHIFGTKSYENIHIIDGTIHAPYKDLTICWRLLKDDNKWYSCHEKATIFQNPNKLQELLPPSYCSIIQIPYTLTISMLIN
jgi:hypothetical protein